MGIEEAHHVREQRHLIFANACVLLYLRQSSSTSRCRHHTFVSTFAARSISPDRASFGRTRSWTQCIMWNLRKISSAAPNAGLTILNVRTCRWLALPHSSELWWRYRSLVVDTIAKVCCTKNMNKNIQVCKARKCESFKCWYLRLD